MVLWSYHDEVVHAGFNTALALLRCDTGGYGNDGNLGTEQLPYLLRGLKPIHDRHLYIQTHIKTEIFILLVVCGMCVREERAESREVVWVAISGMWALGNFTLKVHTHTHRERERERETRRRRDMQM